MDGSDLNNIFSVSSQRKNYFKGNKNFTWKNRMNASGPVSQQVYTFLLLGRRTYRRKNKLETRRWSCEYRSATCDHLHVIKLVHLFYLWRNRQRKRKDERVFKNKQSNKHKFERDRPLRTVHHLGIGAWDRMKFRWTRDLRTNWFPIVIADSRMRKRRK